MAKSLDQLIEEANYWRAKEGLPPLTIVEESTEAAEAAGEHSYAYKRLIESSEEQEATGKAEEESTAEETDPESIQSELSSDLTVSEPYMEENETMIQLETIQPTEDAGGITQEHLICGGIGFLLGALVAFLYFRNKMRKIKEECNTKVEEARAALDRMISVMPKGPSENFV